MKNIFPTIKTIDDVLPAIEGRDEFIVAERDYATIVNYVVMKPDTFDIDLNDTVENHGEFVPKGLIRRECRGLMFAPNGEIMSRSVHKFRNIGECLTTLTSVNHTRLSSKKMGPWSVHSRLAIISGGEPKWGCQMLLCWQKNMLRQPQNIPSARNIASNAI
jgi:hypothetical protein